MRNILRVIIISAIVTVSLQGWEKFFNWGNSQQKVSCDSDRVSMNNFDDPIIDGVIYHPQTYYETRNGNSVLQYVAVVKKWDKNKEYYSVEVYTLKRYTEYRKDDEDGRGYTAHFSLVLSSFNSRGDIFRSSYTVWSKPKGFWSKKTVKLMEILN